jgi:hypothetical protein
MAEDMQRIKDEIVELEAQKQACMDISQEELLSDPSVADRAAARAESFNPQNQVMWCTALAQLAAYQARIHQLTGVTVAMPAFEPGHWEDFWTNQAQLDTLATMINQTMNLARGTG